MGGYVLGQIVRMEAHVVSQLAIGDAALEHQPPHMARCRGQPLRRLGNGQQPFHPAGYSLPFLVMPFFVGFVVLPWQCGALPEREQQPS